MKKAILRDMNEGKWSKVEKSRALNTRISLAVPNELIHDHCALTRGNDHIPDSDIEALIWLHRRKEALVDLVWHVADKAALPQPIRILDLGCGVGGTLSRILTLAEQANKLELVGLTESEEQIAIAEKMQPGITWLAGDLLTFPALPVNWFHLIIAIESTEYLGDKGLELFMARARDLLVPDGVLIIVAHSWMDDIPPPSGMRNRIDQHLDMKISTLNAYKTAAANVGLAPLTMIDLTAIATWYWKIRYHRTGFRENSSGWFEEAMYATLVRNQACYKLLVWRRKR